MKFRNSDENAVSFWKCVKNSENADIP
jgi:hypothetical protein